MFGTVGRMAIDEQVRIRLINQSDQCSRFGRFDFAKIPIQIELLGIFPASHSVFRANLSGPVEFAHSIIAVGVVIGCK